ncbi:MFS transporter [Anaerobacillus sp. CMMVII]|uniref:MDR family MFS transporter n=1 Tax=Anaerobacillus sp. CMMVII TaxID=2755588 RepID=UPI0021B7A55F|nr:MFS transporter [Anaerobacillus sp. CMMVII]MCT8139262.1 MFS transporter [Anaerobacillus sp. CMMVII]
MITYKRSLKQIPIPLWILFVNSFTMALGFFMLIPLLAVYLLDQLLLSATLVGIIVGIRSFCQQGLMIFGGFISDRLSYKNVICLGVFIRAIGFISFGFASTMTGLVVAAILSGLGGALFHPSSYAYYTVLSTSENRATVYAIREMLSNVGFIFGPVIGAFLLGFNFQWVCITAGVMFLIVFLISYFGMPKLTSNNEATKPFVENVREISSNRKYLKFCALILFVWFLVVQLYVAVPVKLQSLQLLDVNVGMIYSAGALIIVFLQVPLINRLSSRFSPTYLIGLGSSCVTLGLIILGFSSNLVGIYCSVIVFTFGQMFIQPMISKQIADIAPQTLIASYFGFNGLALAIGGMVGNLLGGMLYDLGRDIHINIPWVIFSIVGVTVSFIILSTEIRSRKAQQSKNDVRVKKSI